jgi:hypothetical protein
MVSFAVWNCTAPGNIFFSTDHHPPPPESERRYRNVSVKRCILISLRSVPFQVSVLSSVIGVVANSWVGELYLIIWLKYESMRTVIVFARQSLYIQERLDRILNIIAGLSSLRNRKSGWRLALFHNWKRMVKWWRLCTAFRHEVFRLLITQQWPSARHISRRCEHFMSVYSCIWPLVQRSGSPSCYRRGSSVTVELRALIGMEPRVPFCLGMGNLLVAESVWWAG